MDTNNAGSPVPPDLEEVRKPASLLVAQFFLFPLIIIAVCVGIFLLFGYLTYEQRSARDYLNEIRTGSETRRWQAAFELAAVVPAEKDRLKGTEFVSDVIAVYRSARAEDPRVRRFLALALGIIGDSRAVTALVDGLHDPQDENVISGLMALGLIGDNAAVPGVLQQLKHSEPAVRKVAAYVLGALGDASAVRDLQIALNDVRNEVRWNAAMALAQLGDDTGTPLLMKLLDDGYVREITDMTAEQKAELRINAVKCLAMLKFEPAQMRIAELSQSDPNLAVRDASLEALKKF